jgi:[NiFe] hydrogenase diaphorase moiety large subunit
LKPKGKVVIRLCDDVAGWMRGCDAVGDAFRTALGIGFGETTADGLISLEHTACMGMCDQTPAALVNEVVVTNLTPESVRDVVRTLKETGDPSRLVKKRGDGNNASDLVKAMVNNNIRKKGPVIFADMEPGAGLRKALALDPAGVIAAVKASRLRGRGGAGFPTGSKWEFTRNAGGKVRYVMCNADEGEPGTFKDRVILTERADMMFEGMAIAGYAVGGENGIVYLRGEYAYLKPLLESVLAERRKKNLLGKNVCGKQGFNFDIRIQMGAGAYICGEETALISSCEGRRGDPKTRPPFPAQKGYLDQPSVVNNVETFCCAARILEKGPEWFAGMGSKNTTGTRLLSISGDCERPGVYEIAFGTSLRDVVKEAGAANAPAVQVGGPSGQMVAPADFDRVICCDDLATGGSIMIFGAQRDILAVASRFMGFFIEESCGYCTPCRVGNVLLKERLDRIVAGKGEPGDLDYLKELGETVKIMSRCGLGQTSPNPVLTALKNFRQACESRVKAGVAGMQPAFDLEAALGDATAIAGREPAGRAGD